MTTLTPQFDLKNGGTTPTGAINRPINQKLQEIVSANDFGFSASATAADNATALQNAINSFSSTEGGKVYIARGIYSIAADVVNLSTVKYVTIEGAAPAYGYDTPYPATVLSFTTGSIGINMVDATGGTYQGNRLCNLMIQGNDVLDEGVKLNDNVVLEDISVVNCKNYGIHLANATNSAILNRVTSYHHRTGLGFGLYVDGQDTTVYTVTNSNFRANNKGMKIHAGLGCVFQNVVCESNYQEGLYLYRPNSSTPLGLLNFIDVYFENNWQGSPGAAVVIDSATHDTGASVAGGLIFTNVTIAAAGSAQHLDIEAANGVDFYNTTMSGGNTAQGMYLSALWARRVFFHDCQLVTNTAPSFGILSGVINKGNPSYSALAGYDSTMGWSGVYNRVFQTSGGYVQTVSYVSQPITASSSITVPVAVPANAVLLGTQIRVDSTISNAFDAAYSGGATQTITTGVTPNKNIRVTGLFDAHGATAITSTTTNVVITRSGGGSFSAGGSLSVWTYYAYAQDPDPLP